MNKILNFTEKTTKNNILSHVLELLKQNGNNQENMDLSKMAYSSINKGYTFEEYIVAAKKLKKYNIKTLTYLTVKPLFLTNKETIDDVVKNLIIVQNYSDVVSLEPLSIQRGTLVDYLYKNDCYTTPKGWIITEIFKELKNKNIVLNYK